MQTHLNGKAVQPTESPLQQRGPTKAQGATKTPSLLELVQAGLRHTPKRLPSKLLYDQAGSELFERICETPEYYLTRTELAIMQQHGPEIAATLGPDITLLEYGSGSALKTRMLLKQLERPAAYIPVDISRSALMESVGQLQQALPTLSIVPQCADFTQPLDKLPAVANARRTVVYFPGSTIGNLEKKEAVELLRQMRREIGSAGGALIGFDLKKDPEVLEAAYNDEQGFTAEFTLNLLHRLKRELQATIDPTGFRHQARYNSEAGRIETHIVSLCEQHFHLAGETVHFAREEAMLVEISCKYSIREFAALAAQADLRVRSSWCDTDAKFCVQYLLPA